MKRNIRTALGVVLLAMLVLPGLLVAQTQPANSVVGFPGAGVIQAGDLWESFMPAGAETPYYGEAGTAGTLGRRQFIRFGNFDRQWTTPNSHWPAAFPWTMYWGHYMHVMEFNPDTNWNRAKMNGVDNPSYYANSAAPGNNYSNYSYLATHPNVIGWGDATRRYSIEPYWVDGPRRQHVVYEVAWPTNLGVDVVVRAHGFQGPNWNNLNDFVILEISFKNTGVLDVNMDGVADPVANNTIRALALNMAGEIFMSISSYLGGGRSENSITTSFTRMGGYVADPDPTGNPWAFSVYYAGASVQNPGQGQHDMGFNAPTKKQYTDIWNGWVWLDVKQGGLPADRAHSTAAQPSKTNIWGLHPIGVGAERGNYVSAGAGGGMGASSSNPKQMHTISVGTFYRNGGRSRSVADFDLGPNSDFFASGSTGDITTFVPKPTPAPPTGDQKTTNTFTQQPWEDGQADATTQYPAGWGKWTKGFNYNHDFNGDNYSGIGPFSLNPGETMTVVMATVGGFRLEGIEKAVRAARWAYENDYNLPVLPDLPQMKVTSSASRTSILEWNNAAETDPGFAGYKIWKSSRVFRKKWLEEGLRLADNYQDQMVVGEDKDKYKKPVNPKFDANLDIQISTLKGEYQPDTWGTWELLAIIPKAQLNTLSASSTPGFTYKYEDKSVILAGNYYYYISAYKEGSFTGPGGETTNRIETHYTNRNGANGLWQRTFPYAQNNPNYPKTEPALSNIGPLQTVLAATVGANDVSQVKVRPNPYKRAALVDNYSQVFEHKISFYNLPPECTITILDVSGQLIDVLYQNSTAPTSLLQWDMFSKDGIEVASGLYIYIVKAPNGQQQVGYFSILR